MARVAITQDRDDIGAAIERALSLLAVEPLVRGRLVAIKPNDTWASPQDITGVTQGDTLRAVIRTLRRLGPRALVVSGGAGAAETADVFRLSGMMDVIEDEGVEFFDHNRPPFIEVGLNYAPHMDVDGPQRSVVVNPRVLQYETLISLSQLKVHEVATVTLALKNIAMSFPAADHYGHPRWTMKRPHWFFADMHSFIAAMAMRFPIDLAITVGHPAMVGTGPLGGATFETGLCIASTDALAADVVGARMLGFWPQAVRHLWEAGMLGIGTLEPQQMEFPGLDLSEAFARFTEIVYGRALSLQHA